MTQVPNNLLLLFYRHPAACRALGATIYQAAGLALIAGGFTQILKLAASARVGFAGRPPITDIAMLLPSF